MLESGEYEVWLHVVDHVVLKKNLSPSNISIGTVIEDIYLYYGLKIFYEYLHMIWTLIVGTVYLRHLWVYCFKFTCLGNCSI